MDNILCVGMPLYHRTNNTKAHILKIEEKDIVIKLSNPIADKKILRLPITHIGEYLFFSEKDHLLSIYQLAKNPRYLRYNNESLIEAYAKMILVGKRLSGEKANTRNSEKIFSHERSEGIGHYLNYENKMRLIDYLTGQFNFAGFFHYTDFENFVKIMTTGYLYCRNMMREQDFCDAAERDVINKTDKRILEYVRFYYKEKTPTIFVNEGVKIDNSAPHMPIPVILLFKKEIIFLEDVCYTNGGAGNKNSNITNSAKKALSFCWDRIFSRGPLPTDEYTISVMGYDKNKENIKNSRNAELLYKHMIAVDHIQNIIFRCPADLKHAIKIFGKNDLFVVDCDKFNNHRNYLYDYEIIERAKYLEIKLEFHLDYSDYSHEIRITTEAEFLESIKLQHSDDNRIKLWNGTCNTLKIILYKPKNKISKLEYLFNGHVSAVWVGE